MFAVVDQLRGSQNIVLTQRMNCFCRRWSSMFTYQPKGYVSTRFRRFPRDKYTVTHIVTACLSMAIYWSYPCKVTFSDL